MRLFKTLCILTLTQVSLSALPALAEDDGSQSTSSGLSRIVAVPKAAAGVFYGVGLGVPIRMAKYIKNESNRMTKTILDDCGGPGFWNMVMARSCGIPYGIASGTMLGLIRGVQYGGQYGIEEPFSQKSIGIGEPCMIGQR